MALSSLNQAKKGKCPAASLIREVVVDTVMTSDIRASDYYDSDVNWATYVQTRSPHRFVDILRLVSTLPKGRIVAPCDGAGVVALACRVLGRKCYSSDRYAYRGRLMWANVHCEDWTETRKKTFPEDIVVLSHCAEMCDDIVKSFLDLKCDVLYYGKEMMFSGMHLMDQRSSHVWTNFETSPNLRYATEQSSKPKFIGQLTKYPNLGFVSPQGLRAIKMMSLLDMQTNVSYLSANNSDIVAFRQLITSLDMMPARTVDAIVIYSEEDRKKSQRYEVQVLDMRTGDFVTKKDFLVLPVMNGKCITRCLYKAYGAVYKESGKGVGIEKCGNYSVLWFDEPGSKTIVVRGPLIFARTTITVG